MDSFYKSLLWYAVAVAIIGFCIPPLATIFAWWSFFWKGLMP